MLNLSQNYKEMDHSHQKKAINVINCFNKQHQHSSSKTAKLPNKSIHVQVLINSNFSFIQQLQKKSWHVFVSKLILNVFTFQSQKLHVVLASIKQYSTGR